ncbi:hypothetical protein D0867_02797 [Hortaea werneckii]|uniref:THUMP domain-containing protein n=1 Tax=Hortaea werneckii TaxID=91943 RepID=A0A3M7A492_HORWE|nr:hypothetical protein D0867_02797 [Hortaea werneckii]RMY39171.1 hypothetical protein D0866_02103 [Hortaea werneckii]
MDVGTKRKANDEESSAGDKRVKTKKQWRVPRKNDRGAIQAKAIQPGDSGIWATCNKGREGKCVAELRDLFTEYAEDMYGTAVAGTPEDHDEADEPADIESEIQAEVAGMRKPTTVQLFTPVRVDVQCVVFFRTVAPVEPVSFVQRICEDAVNKKLRRRTKTVKRLSPMSLMGRASAEGLESVAKQVLAPHFHKQPFESRKFAIRPTLRNHSILSRDSIIKQVASIVGPGHVVDLKNYDLLIVVEVYQNICGVSVVNNDFEKLKRFNIAEIVDPTPADAVKQVQQALGRPAETSKDQTAGTADVQGPTANDDTRAPEMDTS